MELESMRTLSNYDMLKDAFWIAGHIAKKELISVFLFPKFVLSTLC